MALRHVQLVYEDAERAFTERSISHLTNALNPMKFCSTVKTAVFGSSSSFPTLVDSGGNLVWSADEKTLLFSAHFDAKCRDCFQQPHACDPSPLLCSAAFRSSFVHSLLLDLDPYGDNNPDRKQPLFNKQAAWSLHLSWQ